MSERAPSLPTVPGATYRIRTAAQLTGLSEQLIRAWERRYGVLSPDRTPGGYRAYTEEDIAVLRRLKELTEQGMAISDAARLVGEIRKEVRGRTLKPERAVPAPKAEAGSRVEAWRLEAMAAVREMDQPRLERVLDGALAALPALAVYDQLIIPTAREIGDLWLAGELSVAEEHLASEVFRTRMRTLTHATGRGEGRLHVLAACMPEEQHELGLHGVVLKLRLLGARVTSLGMRTPVEELARAVARLEPDLIALSAVHDPGGERFEATLRELRLALGQHRVVVGGRAAALHQPLVSRAGMTFLDDITALDALVPA